MVVRAGSIAQPGEEEEIAMPNASKTTASGYVTVGGYEGHFEHFDAATTVGS